MANYNADLKEFHSLTLPSQANVYSMTILNGFFNVKPCGSSELHQVLPKEKASIIVAALRKPVYLFNFASLRSKPNEPVPVQQEIPFTYIPHQAEIVAIDGFIRYSEDGTRSSLVIGIAIIKSEDNGSTSQYLNIYSDFDLTDRDARLESLALNCFYIQLGFVPYQVYHCDVSLGDKSEIVWLISGSDQRIHLFAENLEDRTYEEQNISVIFPELDRSFPSVVLWIDVNSDKEKARRMVACGCECGALFVFAVATESLEILHSWQEDFSSPITSVKFFHPRSRSCSVPQFLPRSSVAEDASGVEEQLNIIVTPSGSASVVYKNVASGLENCSKLPLSDAFDVVTCCTFGDVTFDGVNEIILGTYGQVILGYKLNGCDNWELSWKKTWSNPILELHYCDMTGDGVKELVVLTTNGVQILQHDPETVARIVTERLAATIKPAGKESSKEENMGELAPVDR